MLVSVARSSSTAAARPGERRATKHERTSDRTDGYLPRTRWDGSMYVGRFLLVGPDAAAYRVSSRSFPNRKITERDGALTVVPTADAEDTENPYVSYNCARVVETDALDNENDESVDKNAPSAAIGNGTPNPGSDPVGFWPGTGLDRIVIV